MSGDEQPAETDFGERLSVVEQKVDHIEKQLDRNYDDGKERDAKLDVIEAQQASMLQEFSRYRGFVGAILLVLTALSTFVKLFWEDIKTRLFG